MYSVFGDKYLGTQILSGNHKWTECEYSVQLWLKSITIYQPKASNRHKFEQANFFTLSSQRLRYKSFKHIHSAFIGINEVVPTWDEQVVSFHACDWSFAKDPALSLVDSDNLRVLPYSRNERSCPGVSITNIFFLASCLTDISDLDMSFTLQQWRLKNIFTS